MTNRFTRTWKHQASVTTAIILTLVSAGCGSKADGTAASPSAPAANIFGGVDSSSSSNGRYSTNASLQAGCVVEAHDLVTNAVVATGTTSAGGTYTLTGAGLLAGAQYKIIATCGSTKYSHVLSADTKDPGLKKPSYANPRTTLIAAFIVKAITDALKSALGSPSVAALPPAVKKQISDSILASISSVVASVTSSITSAIQAGSMQDPTPTQAGNLTDNLKASNSASDTTVLVNVVPPPPASVAGAVAGAAQAAGAFPACDKTLDPTVANVTACTRAVAQLMYNVLGFTVALNASGSGAFAANAQACDHAHLDAFFTNAGFTNTPPLGVSGAPLATNQNVCVVQSTVGKVSRNSGYDDGNNNNDNTLFSEDIPGAINKGILTAMGASLFNGTKYLLSDVDRLVFGYDAASGAGVNMRLFNVTQNFANGGFSQVYYYLNSAGQWSNVSWPVTCNSSPCQPNSVFSFTDKTWSGSSTNSSLAGLVDGGDFVKLGVFSKIYGGAVPTSDALDAFVNGRTNISRNPTGQQKFQVLYWEGTKNDPNNSCYNQNATTPCVGADNTNYPAVRVDVVLGAPVSGVTPIATINANNTSGAYYLMPLQSSNGYSGAFKLVNVATGQMFRDELLQTRNVITILSSAQCSGGGTPIQGAPSAGSGCAAGVMYNGSANYNCNNGPCTPSLNVSSTTAIGGSYTLTPTTYYPSANQQMNLNGGNVYANFLVVQSAGGNGGDWNSKPKLVVNVATDGSITGAAASGSANGTSTFYVQAKWNCPAGAACTFDSFYPVRPNGMPLKLGMNTPSMAISTYAGTGTDQVCYSTGPSTNTCNDNDIPKWSVAYMNSLTVPTWDGTSVHGAGQFDTLIGFKQVNQGPVINPNWKCSASPYYIDTNGNGKLDCLADDSGPANGDIVFDQNYQYNYYLQTHPNAAIKTNPNGYVFDDPAGTKKLMTTAFNGWFDGLHSINSTTQLNALQEFAFVYLFFSSKQDGGTHIDGLGDGRGGNFQNSSPLFSGGGGMSSGLVQASDFNKAFGGAFSNFHQ